MAERDISPRAGGPADPRSDRDPTALAAWRRVAEQRRRRQIEPGEPEERAEHQGEPAPPTDVARRGTDAGSDGVPRTPTRGDGGAGPRHDLLLALAGRLDDDALSTVRELVAVDDAAAAEMLGGCLLADRIAVTDRERAQLDRWFAGARVDPELLGALPVDPDAAGRARHRFLPDLPGVPTDDGEAVARAAARLPGVAHVRQCWRVTPAGGSPGPLPHRVVLVETESADDCEHVAHHAVHAARSRGAVSVEVYARGAALPAYQRDAVEAAGTGAPVPATSPAVSSSAVSSSAGATPTVTGTTPALPVRRRPGGDVAAAAAALRGERDAAPRALEAPGTDEVAGVTDSDAVGALDELEGLDEAGDLVDAEDPEDRRDTEGWRVVADSDRGATSDGWSMPASVGDDRRDGAAADGAAAEGAAAEGTAAEGAAVGGRSEDEAAGRESIADLDPDAAAARIAALWREPSPVDAFDAPLDDAWSPNLLEPDLPEPDLAHEMSRYDTPRPMTGSFGRVDGEDGPERGDIGHDTEDARDRGDLGALGHPGDLGDLDDEAPTGAHARSGPDAPPFDPRDAAGPDPWSGGRIRRARHSRAGADDEPGPGVDHDIRFGADAPWREGADLTSPVDLEPATTTPTPTAQPPQGPAGDAATGGAPPTRPEPPTGPVSVPAGGAATSTPPPSTPAPNPTSPPAANHPEAEEAMSQLSDRERDLLSRLHAELAARERLETGEPDPFAARGGDPAAPPRPSPGPRPSPSPRRPAGDDPDAVTQGGPLPGRVNGHAHGPLDGHPPGQTNGHTPGRTNGHGPSGGHGPRNGHGLPSAPDEPEDEAR